MANAKFIDATTWGNLTEIDVTDGENLFPQLPAGTYRPVLSGVASVTVPALSAGTIDQATPSEGDTLTVSGSNATGSATYQWQKDGVDISGATSASLDTTGEGTGDYRRGVSDGVQGPVYTSAVTVGAAATAPAQMSAPTVTATGSDSISVDRAAAPSDGGSTITSYDLRHSTDESTWTTVTGIADPQTVSGLTASTLYYVQTRAVNAVGAGTWSTSGTATTDAAPSVLFSDDFTSYALDTVLANTANYNNVEGFRPIVVKDDGGTRIATQEVTSIQNERLEYAGAVSDRRRVALRIHRFRDGLPGGNVEFAGAYTDASNYVSIGVDSAGWLSLRHRVGGVSNVSQDIPPATALIAEGDLLEIIIDGTSVSYKVNGSHVGNSPFTITAHTGYGKPGWKQQVVGDTTVANAYSLFEIEEL